MNGCLVLAAPPAVLRAWGMALCTIGEHFWDGSDYTELDWPASTGEVQVFPDFTERVRRAATVRARLYPGRGHHELEQVEREAIWLATRELIEDTETSDHELSARRLPATTARPLSGPAESALARGRRSPDRGPGRHRGASERTPPTQG